MNNCGRRFTLYQRKAPSRRGGLLAEGSLQIISAGKLGCLRVSFFQRRDGGRQNPFWGFVFAAAAGSGKCAASPHPAALLPCRNRGR